MQIYPRCFYEILQRIATQFTVTDLEEGFNSHSNRHVTATHPLKVKASSPVTAV
jgi:hypothetical protein